MTDMATLHPYFAHHGDHNASHMAASRPMLVRATASVPFSSGERPTMCSSPFSTSLPASFAFSCLVSSSEDSSLSTGTWSRTASHVGKAARPISNVSLSHQDLDLPHRVEQLEGTGGRTYRAGWC